MITYKMEEKIPVVENEKKIITFWKENDIYVKSTRKTQQCNETFTMLDGPPFASGIPHSGNILVSVVKDIISRYKTMEGFSIPRLLGFDCHGLPIENIIENKLGIKIRKEILEYGIDNYNKECRKVVLQCVDEWGEMFQRIGRWNEFPNYYKTMDTPFMESVWWVFKQLFEKGLVYKGYKILPYSTALSTSLSNFEAKMDYRNVEEDTIIVSFPVINIQENNKFHNTTLIAWTTTPWTLPSNLALCVNDKLTYVKVHDKKDGKYYIMEKTLVSSVYKVPKNQKPADFYEIVSEFQGSELVGLDYEPLFNYMTYMKQDGAFKVISDDYVTNTSGTGIVHIAPYYGEDDFRVCLKHGIVTKEGKNMISSIDERGCYTEQVIDYVGRYVKDCDKDIIQYIKQKGKLISKFKHEHEYPFCWRSHTPLLYRAMNEWFVNVEMIKDNLIENNKKINWVPDFMGSKKFGNWLEDAKDWCVSRSRYWGTPIPIWISDITDEIICIGSIEELETLAGLEKGTINDLHREHIDKILIPSKVHKGDILHRIDPVFDCWFESGSVPYAYIHYPFENNDKVPIPIDFISEASDQCRGWFYTLNVLSTALFDKPAFNNVIATGLVLAKDGTKMSKHLGNYVNPTEILGKYGADALRLYLINSPVVRGETMCFDEENITIILKNVIIPLMNSFNFVKEYIDKYLMAYNEQVLYSDDFNIVDSKLDYWIIGKMNKFIDEFAKSIKFYRLYDVYDYLTTFIECLNNGYIKLNRQTLKGKGVTKDQYKNSLLLLCCVIYNTSLVISPVLPFLSEYLYQQLQGICDISSIGLSYKKSVHLCEYKNDLILITSKLGYRNDSVDTMRSVISLIHQIRNENGMNVKMPIRTVRIYGTYDKLLKLIKLERYIKEETNILSIEYCTDIDRYIVYKIKPNFKTLGKTYGRLIKNIINHMNEMTHTEINKIRTNGYFCYNDINITNDFYDISVEIENINKHIGKINNGILIMLDTQQDEETKKLYFARVFATFIQKMRKNVKLHSYQKVTLSYDTVSRFMSDVIVEKWDYINDIITSEIKAGDKFIVEDVLEFNGEYINIKLYHKD